MGAVFDRDIFLASLTHRPGVYRMVAVDGTVLYVGKARDLKNRVASYFGSKAHHPKTQALMGHVDRVEVTLTGSEQEALLLEHDLIKAHRPRFNVLLRDDKSYPWIHVSGGHTYPGFEFYRGNGKGGGQYLGPWPNAGAVRESLVQLQKIFRVRQCSDSFFSNRTRPCLQYQMQRCSAPCVGLISPGDYARDVRDAVLFLQGRNKAVADSLLSRMEAASAALDYERAAAIRDQLALIRRMQGDQVVSGMHVAEADVLGVEVGQGQACVAIIMIRGGRILGSRNWFPHISVGTEAEEVVTAFITQHYFREMPPAEILVPVPPTDVVDLEAVLSTRAGFGVRIRHLVRATRSRWLEMARDNAAQGLATRLATAASLTDQLQSVAEELGLDEVPARVECFDISHTSGGETVAACIVFGSDGPVKSDYRRFNIRGVAPGDDYAAIGQAVLRRYARIRRGEAPVPDLLLIDGGPGQVERARAALEEMQLDHIPLFGVAKGRDRRPGYEKLVRPGARAELTLPPDSPALHLIQRIRDEAHRFAVTGHRQRRARSRVTSGLESIEGLGPQRRRALLREFGGLREIRAAGVADLVRVRGISRRLAQAIYDHLHGDSGPP
ncbi:MAG: excinuclease ABC subunit UvrC [Gammaproteobacteria bacterium]|nr:excinuclease ABC subunit UvrC [Gammaproteobacteria bacterium]